MVPLLGYFREVNSKNVIPTICIFFGSWNIIKWHYQVTLQKCHCIPSEAVTNKDNVLPAHLCGLWISSPVRVKSTRTIKESLGLSAPRCTALAYVLYLFSNKGDHLSYCGFCSFRNLSMLSDLQAHASASLWTFIPSEQWASWGQWPRCNTMPPLQKGPRISLTLEDYCEDSIWANICKADKRTKCWLLYLSML